MKPIFEYTDYREWIRDAFEDFKKRKTVISWRYMAMKLGADPGNLLRISQGKIHLAVNFIKPMAEFFELAEKETASLPKKNLNFTAIGTTTLSVP